MSLTLIDWSIILAYVIFSLGTGIYFARRAGKSPEEYFLSKSTDHYDLDYRIKYLDKNKKF